MMRDLKSFLNTGVLKGRGILTPAFGFTGCANTFILRTGFGAWCRALLRYAWAVKGLILSTLSWCRVLRQVWHAKTLVLRAGALGAVVWTLVSCSFLDRPSAGPDEEDHEGADFIVSEVRGKVVETQKNGLPEEIRISYTACFKDQTHPDNSLPNTLFDVHLFEGSAQPPPPHQTTPPPSCEETDNFVHSEQQKTPSCLNLRTDTNGCLHWTEIYPYTGKNVSRWIGYQRGFEGKGLYRGQKHIPLAVNPWLAAAPTGAAASLQFMDRRYHKLKEDQLFEVKEKNIPACASYKKTKTKQDGQACNRKKKSLSYAMKDFESQNQPPKLWLNELTSNINQEHINIENPTPEQQEILKDFRVCYKEQKTGCDPPGRFFKVQMEMPLRIKVKNYRGETELLPLTKGRYSLLPRLYLSGDKGNQHWILHRELKQVPQATLAEGSKESRFRALFYLHVPYEHYGLTASLALRVHSEANTFGSFEGVFHFPEFLSTIRGKNTLILDKRVEDFYDDQNQKTSTGFIQSHLSLSHAILDDKNRSRFGFRKAGWDVELKRLRFSNVLVEEGTCPTATTRRIRYVGEVCIIDPLTRQPVSNAQIKIQRQNITFDDKGMVQPGSLKEVLASPTLQTTSQQGSGGTPFPQEGLDQSQKYPHSQAPTRHWSTTQGCIQWVDTMQHNWYNREQYFVRRMVFSKEEWGFEGEKVIAINPWHYGFVFFQDITQLGLSTVRTHTRGVEKPRLILHDFRSLFVEPIYTIDQDLGIHLFQNLLFLFKVRVERPDNTVTSQGGKRPSAYDLRRGYYILRFILLKSHTDEGGGAANQVVHHEDYKEHYQNSLQFDFNDMNKGWTLSLAKNNAGQMMNSAFDYITHYDTYVQVRDGTVNAYINFLFDMEDFIFIGSNARVVVQLLPTDPQFYQYRGDTCQVDASASRFVPLKSTEHELISRPFFGSFVPKDLRNWNIFRVLSMDNQTLWNKVRLISLNNNPEDMDTLIQKSRSVNGKEGDVFRAAQDSIHVSVVNWSEASRKGASRIGQDMKRIYDRMKFFLSSSSAATGDGRGKVHQGGDRENRGDKPSQEEVLLSDTQRGQMLELVDEVLKTLGATLSRGAVPGPAQKQLLRIQQHLKEWEAVLIKSPTVSKTEVANSLNTLLHLVSWFLPSLQSALQENPFEKVLSRLEGEGKSPVSLSGGGEEAPSARGFASADRGLAPLQEDSSSLHPRQCWGEDSEPTTGKACGFAEHEGLKPVFLGHAGEREKFLSDLRETSLKYKEYKQKYIFSRLQVPPPPSEEVLSAREQGELIHQAPLNTSEERRQFSDQVREHLGHFENQFPFLNADDSLSFMQKHRNMTLDPLSGEALRRVVRGGIHRGSFHTREVAQFLHLMCGFWFDKFYDEYLGKNQLTALYNKHRDHLNYYLSTGEQALRGLSENSDKLTPAEYAHLTDLMDFYGLQEMDKAFLKAENPFMTSGEASGVVEFVYNEVKQHHAQAFSPPAGMFMPPVLPFSIRYPYKHPYLRCLNNPLNFFHIEKKIIAGDIGRGYSDLKYNYGESRRLAMQTSFDFSYALNWSTSRSFSTSIGTGFSALGGLGNLESALNPLRYVAPLFSVAGLKFSGDWSANVSDSESSRRQQTLRFAQPIELAVNHSAISIALKEFMHCLVIKPKTFSLREGDYGRFPVWKPRLQNNMVHQIPYIKAGLLLCTEKENATDEGLNIQEDYFYIYQPGQGDPSEFLRQHSKRNRPYVLMVRGVTEYEKLMFVMQAEVEADKSTGQEDYDPEAPMTNPWQKQSLVFDGVREAFEQVRLWDKTGFYPGVYHVRPNEDHFYFKDPVIKKPRGFLKSVGEKLHQHNVLGFIPFDDQDQIMK